MLFFCLYIFITYQIFWKKCWKLRGRGPENRLIIQIVMYPIIWTLIIWKQHANLIHERTHNYFRNIIKSNRNQIVFTIFRLIWNPTDVRLVSLCVYTQRNSLLNLVKFNQICIIITLFWYKFRNRISILKFSREFCKNKF